MANGRLSIAFIGFGEAGQAIAAGLNDATAAQMTAWDILFPEAAGKSLLRAADAIGVRRAVSAADAVQGAEIVISAVTAASSLDAARSVQENLRGEPFFLDINSVSPGRKQESAKVLGAAARYIDVAVLAPIYLARHQTPLLLAGPASTTVAPILAALGMRASVAGVEVGAAAAIKMVRSVMIKGIERSRWSAFLPPRAPASSMRSRYRCEIIIPGSIGPRSSPTIWSAWWSMASAAPPKWRKWLTPYANLAWSRL